MMCISNEDPTERKEQRSHSRAIDQVLASDRQTLQSQVQLLLLGKPRAGKTTLVKQLRVKNGQFFSQEESESAKTALLENMTEALKALLTTREELVEPWTDEGAEEDAVTLTTRPLALLLRKLGWTRVTTLLVRLWRDPGIQEAWRQSSTLPGMECLPRFLDNPLRLCDQKFSPNAAEMMRIYRTTCGVCDTTVTGEASFRLVEMGGRSLTTPKLLACFDNVSAVIFVASCCDVEHKIRHGVTTSGFHQTSEFFALVAKDACLFKVPLILLITKLDILMEKAQRFDLRTVLPHLKGDPREEKDVQKCIVDVFREKCAGARPFYHHFLTCTDLQSVQDVFAEMKRDIRDSLLRKLLPQ
ncbi:hypothetical protein ACOMHN_063678 [Nucella lapillus]